MSELNDRYNMVVAASEQIMSQPVIKSPFNRQVLKSTDVEEILAEAERVIPLVSKEEWEEIYIEVANRVRELQGESK